MMGRKGKGSLQRERGEIETDGTKRVGIREPV